MKATSLVLASTSPRRAQILRQLRIAFDQLASPFQERELPPSPPRAFAKAAARGKALAACGLAAEPSWILGADTVVELVGECLLKPRSTEQARESLAALSGRWHRVHTALCLARSGRVADELLETTEVKFRALHALEVDAYVRTGEGMDKAGAYGIQGLGAGLVQEIRGCYWNVVGLPASATVELLKDHGVLESWP